MNRNVENLQPSGKRFLDHDKEKAHKGRCIWKRYRDGGAKGGVLSFLLLLLLIPCFSLVTSFEWQAQPSSGRTCHR